MFMVNGLYQRVVFFGGREYVATASQKEIHRDGKWILHVKPRGKSSGWGNYVLYFENWRRTGKGAWHLGFKDGVFSKSADFRHLCKYAPDMLKWVGDVITGLTLNPAPYPDGFDCPKKGRKKAVKEGQDEVGLRMTKFLKSELGNSLKAKLRTYKTDVEIDRKLVEEIAVSWEVGEPISFENIFPVFRSQFKVNRPYVKSFLTKAIRHRRIKMAAIKGQHVYLPYDVKV